MSESKQRTQPVNMTPIEKAKFVKAANRLNVSLSEFLCYAAHEKADELLNRK